MERRINGIGKKEALPGPALFAEAVHPAGRGGQLKTGCIFSCVDIAEIEGRSGLLKKTRIILNLLSVFFTTLILTAAIQFLVGCGSMKTGAGLPGDGADSLKGLKDFYSGFFPVGVAVAPRSLEGETSALILKHFGSLTAENVMKPGPIHPEENVYFWDDADRIVNYAQENGLLVRGHTLCWHNQNPAWMFKDANGNPASKEVLLARLKEHITQVVTRYKGKVYAWDVLNEVIADDNLRTFRETEWYKICGEEYIAKAFQWAHEADPDAKLFYNDYNTENPAKRDKIYSMVKKLLDAGVPVHGIGLQGHWSINYPTEKNLRDAIEKYSSLGLELQITELDISIYRSNSDTLDTGFTPKREQEQIDQYSMVFRVFRDYKDVISGVTFWNVSDKSSWLDDRAPEVGKKYPLLFDENLKPKKAYWEVVRF